MSSGSRALAGRLLAHPRVLGAVIVVAAAAGIASAPGMKFEAGLGVYFDRSSPLQAELDTIDARFVSDDLLFVVYQTDDVFSHDNLRSIRALGIELETLALDGDGPAPLLILEDLRSLATVDDLVGSDLHFRSQALVPDPVPTNATALEHIRARAAGNPVIQKTLLGRDQSAATMVLRLARELDDSQKADAVGSLRGALERAQRRSPSIEFHLVGMAATESDVVRYQQEDLERFIPVIYLLMAFILFFFFRRALGVIISLLTVMVCLGASVALLLAFAGAFNNTSVMIPPLMMALTVAMLIHYITEYGKHGLAGDDGELPRKTLAQLLGPVFIAAATTAIGFLSLRTSNVPAIEEFGTVAAGAILLAAVLVTAVVTLAFRRWRPEDLISPRGLGLSPGLGALLSWLTSSVRRYRYPVFGASLLVMVFLLFGIGRIVVDQSEILFFDQDTELRRANDAMESEVGGSTVIVAAIGAPEGRKFTDPVELRKLERLERFLASDLGADSVVSIADFVRLMHREFLDGDPAAHRIPDEAPQVAQLLLLNTDSTTDEFLDESRRWVRVVARTPEHSSAQLVADYRRLDAYLAEEFPPEQGYQVHAVANSRLTASMVDDLIASQVMSIGISAILIFALMVLMLRSFRLGLHSIAPNLFPIAVNLGLMGWLGIELNAATVMISTVALGIAVDDTVHFLQHLRTRLVAGADMESAIADTMRTKGSAIIGTSVVISGGFAVLLLSNFAPTRDFAMLMCVTMFAAIVGDLIVLPSFLLVLRRKDAAPMQLIPQPRNPHETHKLQPSIVRIASSASVLALGGGAASAGRQAQRSRPHAEE